MSCLRAQPPLPLDSNRRPQDWEPVVLTTDPCTYKLPFDDDDDNDDDDNDDDDDDVDVDNDDDD